MSARLGYYEFFCGGGMARAALNGSPWRCLFANDIDPRKTRAYADNWGDDSLRTADVGTLRPRDLPGRAALVWASFPCQDLSLAGPGAGLAGARSGVFWPFWSLIEGLVAEKRAPRVIALENVLGALSAHGGQDFTAICAALCGAGYTIGALAVDAALFLPQSRPRLFIIGVRHDTPFSAALTDEHPHCLWAPPGLRAAYDRLPSPLRSRWRWWRLPAPSPRSLRLSDLLEDNPPDVRWQSPEETAQLLAMMSDCQLKKIEDARLCGAPTFGTLYKRTRCDASGRKIQRAEVRFDGIAGCLRTPAGGSSRQRILSVTGDCVRSRLLSSREAARLMGLPDVYRLPPRYNEAYHLLGDGVAVPVVDHLARHLLQPLLQGHHVASDAA
ncbi:MAG: DNA cytosine methyltransferase [Vampirovibrionales bacterium]|nr:DNA cytosine methyltransferase [Vampirovibrionales bacterium]